MNKENNSNINIKKKSFIISLVLVSFISIILLTTSILSSFTSNNGGISSVDAQIREPPSKSPSQLQAEKQQQQSSSDTITTQASSSKCNSIPVQFPISHPKYPIQANTLQNALFSFKFADEKSGAPQAAETRSNDPLRAGFQLDDKSRITCASIAIIPIEIEMPDWTNVGTLCSAIQSEWSSFLSKVSAHEQLHVNFIQTGFANYGNKIVGKTLEQAVTIFDQMAVKVQKQHESIDPPIIPLNVNLKCESECLPGTHLETTCGVPSCVEDGCYQTYQDGACGVRCAPCDENTCTPF